jgi:glycosyltransferase involved in cell wall biosynthesis
MRLFAERKRPALTTVAEAQPRTNLARIVRVIARQGCRAIARRKSRQLVAYLTERLRVARLAARAWQPDGRPVFLMVSHNCGGGTARHVSEMTASLRSAGVRPVLVRPGGSGTVLWEETDDGGRAVWCRRSSHNPELIRRVLLELRPIHAHVHHVLGLPLDFVGILSDCGVPYDWTIHDYHSICPRVNLIGGSGTYCGEPDSASCDRCLRQHGDDQGRPVKSPISTWREHYGRRLAAARRVIAPSEDVRDRLKRYFADLRVLVRPHPETFPKLESLATRFVPGEKVRVAVLGTIVAIKGSDRLLECARDARSRNLPLEFHVIGSTDRDAVFKRIGNVHVSGRYHEQDVYERLARARCHLALLPSLCPESFMYSLSIAMAARLFVFCFDLGAQAQRLRDWGWGRALALDSEPATINDALLATAQSLASGPPPPSAPRPARYPEILTKYYNFTAAEVEALRRAPCEPDPPVSRGRRRTRRRDHAHLY